MLEDTKPGDIIFVMHHDDLISRTIAWFMKSQWSHSALIIDNGKQFTFTTETNVFCVKHGTLEAYLEDDFTSLEIWSPINLEEKIRNKIAKNSLDYVDKAFGWLQLISLGIRRLLMRIGIKIPNFIRQGLVCDHVILYCYKNYISDFPEDKESIDTEELYQIIKNCGQFKKTFERKKLK